MNDIKNRVHIFESINSTHVYLKENNVLLPSRKIIIANTQTNSIGTQNHSWYTGSNNLAMSILYKPNCMVMDLKNLTIEIAQIIRELLENEYELKIDIKKPNDLFIKNKKIAGILVETNTIGQKINYLIISLGVNLNETDFPNELKNIATSIFLECNYNVNRDVIAMKIVKNLENKICYLN